jgi:phospholipid/cholesterol/gamma-HCH transport system permease protein
VNWLLDSLAATGRGVIAACRVTGSLTVFAAIGLSHLVRPPFYGRLFARALLEIGYFSLPVVALTAIFTGMVLALQSYTGFAASPPRARSPTSSCCRSPGSLGPCWQG